MFSTQNKEYNDGPAVDTGRPTEMLTGITKIKLPPHTQEDADTYQISFWQTDLKQDRAAAYAKAMVCLKETYVSVQRTLLLVMIAQKRPTCVLKEGHFMPHTYVRF